MNFYTNSHPYYCGIDLHARSLYVCIIDQAGQTCVHIEIGADPDKLLKLLTPYHGQVVVGVECMHCWYGVADFCEAHGFDFILGHALYMRAIHGGKAKNDRIDSFKIAHLIRGGNFPMAYVYPKAMRATRDLLRRRMKLVRHGADLKAHEVEDWILEQQRFQSGTGVFMQLSNNTARTSKQIFDSFTSDDDYGFTKTVVPVRLTQYGDDKLVSRSQAKRLLARVEKFKTVFFDFDDVDSVGQAFADEIFRVFQMQHPDMELIYLNANKPVQQMISRALTREKP